MADDASDDNDHYAVGRGKPPVHTRWKKGVSGNPTGRSKKPISLADIVAEEGAREIRISKDGRDEALAAIRVVVRALFGRAAQRDNKAAGMLLDFYRGDASATAAELVATLTTEEDELLDNLLTELKAKREAKP